MFDIRGNDIWWNGNIFAIIVAQGRSSLGWGETAREELIGNPKDEIVQLAKLQKLFKEAGSDFQNAPVSELCKLEDLPEGMGYTKEETDAAAALSWHIRPEMKAQFDLLLRAHIRRERASFGATLTNLYNDVEKECT